MSCFLLFFLMLSILLLNLRQSRIQVIPWTLGRVQVLVTQDGEARGNVTVRHARLQQLPGGCYGGITGSLI